MHTTMSFEEQYRNIVRKFFFRQNPPHPFTLEEYSLKYGLENVSRLERENRYYSYLYCYNYDYVKKLDEQVGREIREGALNDPYLAEIEKKLEDGRDSKKYVSKIEPMSEEDQTIDSSDISFSKKPKKRQFFHKREKDKSKKRKFWKEKPNFLNRFSKESSSVAKEDKKDFKKIVLLGAFSLLAFMGGVYGFSRTLPKLIYSGFDFVSCSAPLILSTMSFIVGGIGTTIISFIRDKNEEDEYMTQDDYDTEEEETIGVVDALKDRLGKSKKKEEQSSSVDQNVSFEPERQKISNTAPKFYVMDKENDERKPKLPVDRAENHPNIQIAEPLLEYADPSSFGPTESSFFDGLDEEVAATKNPVKVKIR